MSAFVKKHPAISLFVLVIILGFPPSVAVATGRLPPATAQLGALSSSLAGLLLKGPAIPLLGPQPTSLIGGMGYIILAQVLLFNRRAFAGEKAAGPERVRAVAEV